MYIFILCLIIQFKHNTSLSSTSSSTSSKNQKRIAAFNGFDFHFETLGFIIYFAYSRNYLLTVYTNLNDPLHYIPFYQLKYNSSNIIYKNYTLFPKNNSDNKYDLIIISTDDDYKFNSKWVNNKTFCIDHVHYNRASYIKYHIGIRKFKDSKLNSNYAIPTYPLVNVFEKYEYLKRLNNIENKIKYIETNNGVKNEVKVINEVKSKVKNEVNIAIIGGNWFKMDIINRLEARYYYYNSNNNNTNAYNNNNINAYNNIHKQQYQQYKYLPINLHVMARNAHVIDKNLIINKNITLYTYRELNTIDMHTILLSCHYILTDATSYDSHTDGYSSSGAIPFAYSNLITLIINTRNNKYFQFLNVVEFNDTIITHKSNNNINNNNNNNNKNNIKYNNNYQPIILKLGGSKSGNLITRLTLIKIAKERNKLIKMFHDYCDTFLFPK
jgi:hypothetical protein